MPEPRVVGTPRPGLALRSHKLRVRIQGACWTPSGGRLTFACRAAACRCAANVPHERARPARSCAGVTCKPGGTLRQECTGVTRLAGRGRRFHVALWIRPPAELAFIACGQNPLPFCGLGDVAPRRGVGASAQRCALHGQAPSFVLADPVGLGVDGRGRRSAPDDSEPGRGRSRVVDGALGAPALAPGSTGQRCGLDSDHQWSVVPLGRLGNVRSRLDSLRAPGLERARVSALGAGADGGGR